MSMHWEGYSELGLVLNGDDLDIFKENYLKKHKDLSDDEFEDMLCEREDFLYSDGSGRKFSTLYLTEDCIEGATLLPVTDQGGWWLQELPTVIILAANSNAAINVFRCGFYKNREELIEEMKEKVGGYLPDDFRYDSHTGDITYACFA